VAFGGGVDELGLESKGIFCVPGPVYRYIIDDRLILSDVLKPFPKLPNID